MAKRRSVGGSVVRTWALSDEGQALLSEASEKAGKDLTVVGDRGRFAQELVDAFHKANKGSQYTPNFVPTRKITGTRETETGRKQSVTVTATLAEVRAFAKAEGLTIGERGRVSKEVLSAFAARPKVTA